MDRNPTESGLILPLVAYRGVSYALAGPADDHDVRRILMSVGMDGWVRLVMAREPDAFAAHRALGRSGAFIIARDMVTGEVIGLGEYVASRLFINGAPCTVPYFGSLRVMPHWRNKTAFLKMGMEGLRRLQEVRGDPMFALTSIASGNNRASRLLTANMPGMPDYHPVGRMVTLVISTARGLARDNAARVAGAEDLLDLAQVLLKHGASGQFAPVWDAAHLRHVMTHGGMSPSDFRVIDSQHGLGGTIAVWDQRAFKQVVALGYAPWLGRLRLAVNFSARVLGKPVIPKQGSVLKQVYLSHFTCGDEAAAFSLIGSALALAREKGAQSALLGLSSNHPLLRPIQRRFSALTYETDLYMVTWKSGPPPPTLNSERMLAPDIAML